MNEIEINVAFVEYNKYTKQYDGGYDCGHGCGTCEFDTRQECIDWIIKQTEHTPHFFGLKVIYDKVWQNFMLRQLGIKK